MSGTAEKKQGIPVVQVILGALAFLILVGGIFLAQYEGKVSITQEKAQALLDENLPKMLEKHPKFTITEHPKVIFNDNSMRLTGCGGSKVGGNKVLGMTLPEKTVSLCVDATGDPDLRGTKIYFEPAGADAIKFSDITIDGNDPASAVGDMAAGALSKVKETGAKVLGALGVKTEEPEATAADEQRANIDALIANYRAPAEEKFEAFVVQTLRSTALYDITKHKHGWLAAMALTDIGIENGEFTATISGYQVVMTILIGVLVLAVVLVMAYGIMIGGGGGFFLAFGALG